MHNFGRHNVDELPVVESKSTMRFIGTVQRKDVIDAYNREIFKTDLVGGVHSIVSAVSSERDIEISEGFKICEVDPPGSFLGRSLKEINIRARYGVEVILIRKPVENKAGIQNRPGAIPSPDYVIEQGDTLLVLGDDKAVKNFRIG